jgi:hypothetical protein
MTRGQARAARPAEILVISLGAVVVGFYVLVLVQNTLLVDRPARTDFIAFHAAGRMALAGHPAEAYDWARLHLVQAETLGTTGDQLQGYLAWLNPPPFLLYVVLLGLLPYGPAWFAWVIVTAGLLVLAVRSAAPGCAATAAVAVLAAPAVLICMGLGQNGLLTAALMCWTFALMDRRPLAAGLALGLLTFKPHFGLLIPLLLVATGRWRVFGAAAAVTVLLVLASLLAFGPQVWAGFLHGIGRSDEVSLAAANPALPRIQSVFALTLGVMGDRDLAWTLHAAVAAAVAVVALRLWVRRPEGPAGARSAAAMAAAFLMTPYGWIYDAPAIAVAALFLVVDARRDGWLPGEAAILLLACLLPGVMLFGLNLPVVAPAAWLLILACAWRRDRACRVSPAPNGSPSAGT